MDDEGNLTGIIDWDNVQTCPRCLGYAAYPGWISRDWDPLMYGWPMLPDSENSPDELERYRKHYNEAMGEAMGKSGDWEFTEKSHVWEAVWIAATNSMNQLDICRKFIEQAGDVDMKETIGVLMDIGDGYMSDDDWEELEEELEDMVRHSP